MIEVKRVDWSDNAGECFSHYLPSCHPDDLKAQVLSGEALLFEVLEDGDSSCFYMIRVEHLSGYSEGVLVALAGKSKNGNIIDLVLPFVERQFVGVQRVRVHTSRAGVMRVFSRHGYEAQELIMSKAVGNG